MSNEIKPSLAIRLLAELIGTGLILATIVGAGLRASSLFSVEGFDGIKVLFIALSTGLMFYVVITALGHVSGGHLNPAVTIAEMVHGGGIPFGEAIAYIVAQIIGGILGVMFANAMFDQPQAFAAAEAASPTMGNFFSELFATALLIVVVFSLIRRGASVPIIGSVVGTVVAAGIMFTSSGFAANPAIAIGRIFTDSLTGIGAMPALWMVLAEVIGAVIGALLVKVLVAKKA